MALPASSLRMVTTQTDLVSIPFAPPILAGLCHNRGDFLLVLTLDGLLKRHRQHSDEFMLIVDDLDGPWGLLVDEVQTLTRLEISSAAAPDSDDGIQSLVIGWASFDQRVIRVLDHYRLREIAEEELARSIGLDHINATRLASPSMETATP